LTDFSQFERDRRWPAFRFALARLAYRWLPRVVMAGLEIGAAGLDVPQIPHLFSRDVREFPSTLNDDLLDLFGVGEKTLSNQFIFQKHSKKFPETIDWQRHEDPAWLAELHAFDYGLELALNYRISGEERYAKHLRYLIASWIAANPPGRGPGWLLHPLARRVRNWILSADLARGDWERDAMFLDLVAGSLALQATFLFRHAAAADSANDALDCARALLLAAKFFGGSQAARHRSSGDAIILQHLESHFSSAGQYIEPRPGSQARLAITLLERLLFNDRESGQANFLKQKLATVLGGIEGILLPEGVMPLFGPAPCSSSAELADIFAFAAVLLNDPIAKNLAGKFGVLPYLFLGEPGKACFESAADTRWVAATRLQPQSSLYRLSGSESSAAVITGRLSVSQHDHQDSFSYELSIHGQHVVVDSGAYAPHGEPSNQFFASARAHNVMLVDEQGPRGQAAETPATHAAILESREGITGLQLAHTGFSDLGLRAQRAWFSLNENVWVILDRIEGAEGRRFTSLIHFYPTFNIELRDARAVVRSHSLTLSVIPLGSPRPNANLSRGDDPKFPGWYAPEIGMKLPASVLRLEWEGVSLPWLGGYLIVVGESPAFETGETNAAAGATGFSLFGKQYQLSFR
jgi:hypothetical protein